MSVRPPRKLTALVLTALVGVAAAASGAAPAAATAGDQDGLWYYTATGLDRAHQTSTGEGITVAVLDGPVNPAAPDLVGTDLVTHEVGLCTREDGTSISGVSTDQNAEHATNVTSMIIGTGAGVGGQPGMRGVAPGAKVLHWAVKDSEDCWDIDLAGAIDAAIDAGADIINISQRIGFEAGDDEALVRAQREGVIVVVAVPNEAGTDLQWPAGANGVVSVQGADANLQLNPDPVTSPQLGVVAPGVDVRILNWDDGGWDTYRLQTGNSLAAPFTTGVLALIWSQHPDATANQVIQTLLRTTSGHNGELSRDDSWGYGAVSANGALAADPTTYPDVNPLLLDDPFLRPAYEDVLGDPTPTPTPQATEQGTPPPTVEGPQDEDGGSSMVLPLVLAGGALLLLVAVVAVILLARRRPEPTTPRPAP
jgi:subtilisin family serine protease